MINLAPKINELVRVNTWSMAARKTQAMSPKKTCCWSDLFVANDVQHIRLANGFLVRHASRQLSRRLLALPCRRLGSHGRIQLGFPDYELERKPFEEIREKRGPL